MWLYIMKGYGSQDIYKYENNPLIIKIKRLEHYWQIDLKRLFPGVMSYWFLTFMQMVSTYSPVPYCSGIKVYFWASFLAISLYHFPLLQEFELKNPSSFFKDLDKFRKHIRAISFPLTVRHGKLAFEYVTRP